MINNATNNLASEVYAGFATTVTEVPARPAPTLADFKKERAYGDAAQGRILRAASPAVRADILAYLARTPLGLALGAEAAAARLEDAAA